MANIFSGNSERNVPKSLNECYETDSVSNNLLNWSKHLDFTGGLLSLTISLISFVAFIPLLLNDELFMAFITLIPSAVLAIILNLIFHTLSLLIASLANIVQSTRISANVSVYNTAKAEGLISANRSTADGKNVPPISRRVTTGWQCRKCGSNNPQNALYCKDCGKYK